MELFKAHILYRVRPNLKALLEAFQLSCRKTSGEPNSTNIDPHVRQLTTFYSTLQVTISATVWYGQRMEAGQLVPRVNLALGIVRWLEEYSRAM